MKACEDGVRSLFVAEVDGQAAYCQWLVRAADQAAIQRHSPHTYAPLRDGEVLLEGAYTFTPFRGKKAMAAGMVQLLHIARDEGAVAAITYVAADNVPSLRGCARVGFVVDRRRVTTVRFGRRRSLELAADDAGTSRLASRDHLTAGSADEPIDPPDRMTDPAADVNIPSPGPDPLTDETTPLAGLSRRGIATVITNLLGVPLTIVDEHPDVAPPRARRRGLGRHRVHLHGAADARREPVACPGHHLRGRPAAARPNESILALVTMALGQGAIAALITAALAVSCRDESAAADHSPACRSSSRSGSASASSWPGATWPHVRRTPANTASST